MSDYLKFWGADAAIFLRPPAAHELYLPPSRAALVGRFLLFCREQRQTVVLLTGEPGTGKSTLLKWLYGEVQADTHEILLTTLFRRENAPGWLTPRLAELMGVTNSSALPLEELIRVTAARLDELIAEDRRLLVALDAAHLATGPEALAEVTAFLNLQSLAGACLTFVLCGQPELAKTVAESPALASRVVFSLALAPLTAPESKAYVEHRCRVSGLACPFDDEALALVHQRTQGLYAALDSYAENCLVEAFQRGQRQITGEVARAAAGHLGLPLEALATSPRDALRLPAFQGEGSPEGLGAPYPPPHSPSPPFQAGSTPPVPEPPQAPLEKAREGSASIKLTSLFKSDPSRPKS